jgi:hypothetical protein
MPVLLQNMMFFLFAKRQEGEKKSCFSAEPVIEEESLFSRRLSSFFLLFSLEMMLL